MTEPGNTINANAAALQPDGRPSLGDGKVAQALRKENEDLLKQLNELQKTHLFKTKQLQDKLDEAKQMEVDFHKLKDEVATMRHESSFQEKETQIEELHEKIQKYQIVYEEANTKQRTLMKQNDELRVKHQKLVMEMDDLRRIADKDRKSRRQSSHDDRRGVFFNTRDGATMTDPTSADCSCQEMDAQIRELRKQLTIKDCQLNTQKMMASVNPLKNDVVELRGLLKTRENEIFQLQKDIQTLSVSLDQERKQADKRCQTCARQQRLRSLRSDKAIGTEPNVFTSSRDSSSSSNGDMETSSNLSRKLEETQEELRKLSDKYQQMKRLCRMRNETIVSLSEKENESSNANRSIQQEVSALRRQLKESEDKFLQMQKAHNGKNVVLKVERNVQTEPFKLEELETLRTKYDKYKTMAISLVEQNEELKKKLQSS
ncbi:putative leucine-rich repeat-containing protein DDB_G0290503 [Uranotaenia lowii]|uniref:putative leucine-rich repeat-containing protein DDB_G0290503 n=1 Tax=Uranotaenia lowii TaxID=190385 RepID=UPI00247938DD|nr:putative leucine-rich repeat-containing protein DDB_G0290503 [Uranotaenia lowii]